MSAPAGSGARNQAEDRDRDSHPVGGRLRTHDARELFVRRVRKDGRTIAVLRGVDYGDHCVVEAEVFPRGVGPGASVRPGPYTFADAAEATEFASETVEALMYLGCQAHSQ